MLSGSLVNSIDNYLIHHGLMNSPLLKRNSTDVSSVTLRGVAATVPQGTRATTLILQSMQRKSNNLPLPGF
jgi:hypothetical protein